MTPKIHKWYAGLILWTLASIGRCEDGSLQSALNAIDRKQQDLWDYPRNGEFYSESGLSHYNYYEPDENDGLVFLTKDDDYVQDSKLKSPDFEHGFYDYAKEDDLSDAGSDLDKRISSSFRERLEEDKARQREKLVELLLNKIQDNKDIEDMDQYTDLMQLWDEYSKNYPNRYDDVPQEYHVNDLRKRYYTNFQPVGMKRSHYFETNVPNDYLYFLNYGPRDGILEKVQDSGKIDYDYSSVKRFPVTKRSSNYYPIPYNSEISHHHKRSPKKESLFRTDPKIAKDLSNIFSSKSKRSDSSAKPKENLPKKTTPTPKIANKKEKLKAKKELPKSKETIPMVRGKEEPLQIEKKSINWSNYFGLDRRKKLNDVDNEWLMERYHKTVAMAAKRNADSKFVKSADNSRNSGEKSEQNIDETKISQIDSKLKSIEDSIVDKTLKYTGAHEGAVDSKEIQEVKDRVISQLAAAYSLEKMRRALGEYKKSIERQKNRMKEMSKDQDHLFSEEKRLSVPRKSAIDETRLTIADADNSIKCTHGDEECNDQNYRVPADLIEQVNWDREPCPNVHKVCNELSSALGQHGRTFESACIIHQNCLICGDNEWFTPIRQCNILFLTKADEICGNDVECQRIARDSIGYLTDVSRSIKAEPMEACNLLCPEKRR